MNPGAMEPREDDAKQTSGAAGAGRASWPNAFRGCKIGRDDLEAYERDGVVHLRDVLTEEEVLLLRTAVDRQFSGRKRSKTAYDFQALASQLWRNGGKLQSHCATRFDLERLSAIVKSDSRARPLFDAGAGQEAGEGVFFYEAAGWRIHPEIRQVALDSRLPEISAILLDSEYVNFWEDTTFVKTPGATLRTPFHQDYTYFQISGAKCCVAWIPLDETTPENGALEYVVGSHKWGLQFAPSVFVSQTPLPESPYQRLPDIERQPEEYDIKMICAKPGDVVIHNVMTVHGSRGNRTSDSLRRGISFRYCGDDVRYLEKPGAMKQPWIRDRLKDGDILYTIDYPRVWPRPFPGAQLSKLYAA